MAEVLQCDWDSASEWAEDNQHWANMALAFAAHREAAEKAERQAVVDWLRGPAFGDKSDWNVAHASEFADAIERRDHRKG